MQHTGKGIGNLKPTSSTSSWIVRFQEESSKVGLLISALRHNITGGIQKVDIILVISALVLRELE